MGRAPPKFFPLDEKMAFIPAAILGFQHMIAMLIGLITPASILANNTNDQHVKIYLINASIIVAGIMTIIQSAGVKHPRLPFQWGAGTLSVMGARPPCAPRTAPHTPRPPPGPRSSGPAAEPRHPLPLARSAGVSFTTVPIAQMAVPDLMAQYPPYAAKQCGHNYDFFTSGSLAGGSPCASAAPGASAFGGGAPFCIPNCQNESFNYAWGKVLGTTAFCALIPAFISMLKFKYIKQLFPPVVVGPVIMLIGINLIGAGFGDWGGGTFCAQRVIYNGFSNNLMSAVVTNDGPSGFSSTDGVSSYQAAIRSSPNMHQVTVPLSAFMLLNNQPIPANLQGNVSLLVPNTLSQLGSDTFGAASGSGFFTDFTCSEAANVDLVYGATEYVGLGFLTFVTIMFVEIFGSPFMRNCSSVIGVLWGYAAATWSRHRGEQYVTRDQMNAAPGITFLWTGMHHSTATGTKFFPLSFYPPLIIPLFIVFTITTCETWADTLASMEASRLDTTGQPLQIMRQKGALLNDTLSGILAALSGVLPLTTFAQNNGIISLTAVATRRVGVACGIWLCLLGILSKIGAWIQSIPGPVLGGMTTFLFANVLASGMHILLQDPGALKRRNRFILAATMAVGVGVTLWPAWAREALWPIDAHMADGSKMGRAKKGVRDAIILILSTGFVFGFFVAFFLYHLLPEDREELEQTVHLGGHVESAETLSKEQEVEVVAMA